MFIKRVFVKQENINVYERRYFWNVFLLSLLLRVPEEEVAIL
jgi:hypothetical protein